MYVSVNAVRPGQLTRTRRAIRDIRHIFAEADHDGDRVVRTIDARSDLPRPSYLLHSSPNRVHVFWRAAGFAVGRLRACRSASPSCGRTRPQPSLTDDRLPGFLNHKYRPRIGAVEYRCKTALRAGRFSGVRAIRRLAKSAADARRDQRVGGQRRYLAALPPAIPASMGALTRSGIAVSCAVCVPMGGLNLLRPGTGAASHRGRSGTHRQTLEARRYGREPIGGCCRATNEDRFESQPSSTRARHRPRVHVRRRHIDPRTQRRRRSQTLVVARGHHSSDHLDGVLFHQSERAATPREPLE